MKRTYACAAAFALFAPFALAADGDVDLAFGDAGQVTIARPPGAPTSPTPVGDVLGLADGSYLWSIANENASVWLGRTRRDGSADATFGSDGTGRVALTGCIDFAPTFLASDDAGGAYVWTGACLVHVEANGAIDAGFGGVPLIGAGDFAIDFARDAAGRFVIAATTGLTWDVMRFAPDGVTPDAGFGGDGHVRIAVPATNNLRGINALAMRDDGRIVVAGWRGNASGPNLVVAALTESGKLDPYWNGGAIVDLDPPVGQAGIEATALAIDADGTLVVGGFAASGRVGCCLLLTRLDAAGAVVADFGLRLYELDDTALGSFFEGRDALALGSDGRILFATTAFPFAVEHRTQFVLMRTTANGVLDERFGSGGWRGYTIADPDDAGQSGDYVQLHAIAAGADSVLLFGRTFFEDNSNGLDYVSMVRTTFEPADRLFESGFDP
ncbi:MAG TPA: hypothetical protein VJ724_05350 [Tahibacter sp.]|nr:hypothetical protein [Tahibacter sp.]